jgi:hypothetical protein
LIFFYDAFYHSNIFINILLNILGLGSDLVPRFKLEEHFNKMNRKDDVALLKSFDSYLKSMPVRRYDTTGDYIRLCELEYLVRPNELKQMVQQIIKKPSIHIRAAVKYISAPTASGKTCSVLAAFLEATKMIDGPPPPTHYLYIAFANNNRRNFQVSDVPNLNLIKAEQQGAAFMVECVKVLLEKPDKVEDYILALNQNPPSVGDSKDTLNKYLLQTLGSDCNIWFHVDEHAKMCKRDGESIESGARFSKGAMELLANCKNATVIATYTERPLSINPESSSMTCRLPVAIPSIDINKIMEIVPELSFNSTGFKPEQKRLLASFKFRLGMMLREKIRITDLINRNGDNLEVMSFLNNIASAKLNSNPTDALKKCNNLCKYNNYKLGTNDQVQDARKILLGFIDTNERQISDIVGLPDGSISVSLMKLLTMDDPNFGVFSTARHLFQNVFTLGSSEDLISSTPLERAYLWSLACASSFNRKLKLGSNIFKFVCNNIKPGRIFPGADKSVYDLNKLEPHILYYAIARNGEPTHPLADLFFRTTDNEIVLIDIFGGGSTNSTENKINNLKNWIGTEQSKNSKFVLRGVVIAPFLDSYNETKSNVVSIVKGESARSLLGGLIQVSAWMSEDEN